MCVELGAQGGIENGKRPGTTLSETAELREERKPTRILEQANEVFPPPAAIYLGQGALPKDASLLVDLAA